MKNDESQSNVRPLWKMFEKLPYRYDLINRLFTLGLDERWRKKAAKMCLEFEPKKILDLGCGTGDMLVALASMAEHGTTIIGADFSESMLNAASAKISRFGLYAKVSLVQADAAQLPWTDGYFDAITISFAFRNMTFKNPARARHLSEIRRVLARDGKLLIVESSQPKLRALRAFVHFYERAVVGPLGGWLSGEKAAYRYLSNSALRFYSGAQLSTMLQESGFSNVTEQSLMGGTAAIHIASGQ